MSDKIKVGYYLARNAHTRLKGLAKRDNRSMSGELAWLIEREWKQYMAHLRTLASVGRASETQGEGRASPTGDRGVERNRGKTG